MRALTRLDDSKVHDPEQREALYPLVVRTAATRRRHLALRARDRRRAACT